MINESVKQRGLWWRIINSWWILLSFIFLGGIAFLIIGNKTKQRKWVIWGIFYFVAIWVPLCLVAFGPAVLSDWCSAIWLLVTIMSIIHSFFARKEYLIRLDAILTEEKMKNMMWNQTVGAQGNFAEQAYEASMMSGLNSNVNANMNVAPAQPHNPNNLNVQPDIEPSVQSTAQAVAPEKIDINNCSANELQTLPGVNVAAAKKAVSYREEHGGFSSNDEFYSIAGIGDKPHFISQLQDKIICGTYDRAVKLNGRSTKLDFD